MKTRKRFLSLLLAVTLCLSMLPVGALAAENEETEPETECVCTELCTGESVNADCPICGAVGADLTACAGTETQTVTPSNALNATDQAGDSPNLEYNNESQLFVHFIDGSEIILQNVTFNSDGQNTLTIGAQLDSISGALDLSGTISGPGGTYTITTIGDEAFENCTGLTSITLPASVTSIGDNAFGRCSSLTAITVAKENANYTAEDGVLFNKDKTELIRYPEGKTGTSYIVPATVTTIRDSAFSGCTGLTSITISASVTSVNESAFYGCSKLDSITVAEENANYTAEDGVLFNKDKTELIRYPEGKTGISYIVPEAVTTIGESAFYGCAGLISITLPDNLTTIGINAYNNCTGLSTIDIPDGVTTIEYYAFSGCTGLTSIDLPDELVTIENSAFANCTKLTSITLPDGLVTIGSTAFRNCTGLTSIDLPASVTSVDLSAFDGCSNLTAITVDEGNTSYTAEDGVLFNKDKTELLQYPVGKEETSYIVPETVTSIGDMAFYNCTNLETVTVFAATPPALGVAVFDSSLTILVPPTAVDTYKTAAGWSRYASQISSIPAYSVTVTAEPDGGGTASASVTSAIEGAEITLTATPNTGYHFVEWQVVSGDITISEQNTFTMPAKNVEVRAVFAAHAYGEWQSNSDGTHSRTCACGDKQTENCSDGTASYFKQAVCSICGEEYGSLVTDTTVPTGKIKLGTDSWKSFLHTITFGLFFKDTQSVEITASDDSYEHTGYTDDKAVKIEYLIHEGDGLSISDLETQAFTEYTGEFSIRPDKKFVIYVRLTDHADNVTYLSSNGIVLDSTAATAPTVTTNGYTSGNWTDEDVTITVSGSLALSGIDKYQVSTDNGASWTDMTMTDGTASLTVSENSTSADGTTYIFRAVSKSGVNGNTSAPITVKIDKTEPTLTLSGNKDDYLQSDTVTVSASAGISGIAKVEVSKDGGEAQDITDSYANGYTVTENGTYTFTVTNGAGVTDTDSITYTKLDRTKPVVSLDTHGYTSDEWTNGDVTLSVSDTSAALGETQLEYKVGDGQWQEYTDTITVSEDTNGTVYSFRAVSASGVESETVSVTVKIDKTAPDGDITIEENSVKKFIHDVTFGLFFKENVEVAITDTDGGSGVQTVEYYRSAEALTEEQVAALTEWTAYTGAISETAQDAETFVYYVRITDQVGNTTCFASNGATFDLTKPVIAGVTDGAEYCTTQSVQATDANLDSVTLNGQPVTPDENGAFTLVGNTETEYVIVAADKAGNETTVTVTMKKTDSLKENLGGITIDNATSADRETVQDYLDDLKDRLEDEKLTDEEKEILEGLADEAQDILDRLDEAEQAGVSEAVDQTQGITSDNVTPEDKEVLEQAKEDIEQALDQFGGNYTDEERAELEEDLSRIEEALEVIERIENTEAAIEALPDTVSPDDTEAEEQIHAAKDLYDDLNDYEKSQISEEAKEKLEGLLAALRDYRITDGSGSTFTKGNTAGLTFTANGAYSKFTGIEVDGEAVNADGYTAENGSTVITLKAEYLETLAAGEHTLTVLYTDGEATGTFTVAEKPAETVDDDSNKPQTGDDGDETGKDDAASSETGDDSKSPETGDDSNIALWIAVMLAAGTALTGTVLYSRKRKYSE